MEGNVLCVKDMWISDKLVFEEGEYYKFKTLYADGKAVAFNIGSSLGMGYTGVKDSTLSTHFKKYGSRGFKRLTKKVSE